MKKTFLFTLNLIVMNKYNIILVVVYACLLITSCIGSLSECANIEKKELVLLLDLTDPLLFEAIDDDIKQNFGSFMSRTGLSNISTCSEFKLGMAPITASDNLNLLSHTIGVNRKGLSRKAERDLANPSILVNFMNHHLDEYKKLSHLPETTARSVIANVIFKAIVNTDSDAESVVLIFSDLAENNGTVNFYRRIPPSAEIPGIINQMVETSVLDQLNRRQQRGLTAKIIIVLMPEPSGRPDIREIRRFWTDLFDYLKLDVQFIDNLTNTVEL